MISFSLLLSFQEKSLPGLHNAKDRLGIIDYDRVIKEYRSRVVAKPSETLKLPKLPPTVRGVSAPERESLDGAAKDLLLSSDIDKETIASARVTEDSGSESGGTEERQEENRLIRKTSKVRERTNSLIFVCSTSSEMEVWRKP